MVEAKRPSGSSRSEIGPYAPAVVEQTLGYASQLGTPYFVTFNGEHLVLFYTHEQGVPFLERSPNSYTIGDIEMFPNTLLNEIVRFEANQTNWDSLDDASIKRMQTLHEFLGPRSLSAKDDSSLVLMSCKVFRLHLGSQ